MKNPMASLGGKGFLQVFKPSGVIGELREFMFSMIFCRILLPLCYAIFLLKNRSDRRAQTSLGKLKKTPFFETRFSAKTAKID